MESMSNLGNYLALGLVLAPVGWRKASQWRHECKQRQEARLSRTKTAEKRGRFHDFSLRRPSDVLVLLAALALLSWHTIALLWPAQQLFRTDLFMLLGLQANAPIAYVRGRAAALPFDGIRWKADWGEEGLELLLRRLGSFEGRKLHLALGIEPFVACTFCTTSDDYRLFAALRRLGAYSVQLLFFGILTMRHDALEVLDETFFATAEFLTGRDLRDSANKKIASEGDDGSPMLSAQMIKIREDRKPWRKPILYLLALFAAVELSVYASLYDLSLEGSRWDHFHHNVRLAWHSVLLAMAVFVYASPQTPTVHPIHEVVHLLQQAKRHTDESLGQVQAMHLAQQIMWGDSGLRRHVSKWHDERDESFNEGISPETLQRLAQRAARNAPGAGRLPTGSAVVNGQRTETSQEDGAFRALREMARATSAQLWLRSARNWQRAMAARTEASSSPSTPQSVPTAPTSITSTPAESDTSKQSKDGNAPDDDHESSKDSTTA